MAHILHVHGVTAWYNIANSVCSWLCVERHIHVYMHINCTLLALPSILYMLCKPLPKWLVFLCPRQWEWEEQFWEWPGPLPKVMWPSLGTLCSTEEMGLLPGAVNLPSQAHLLQPLLFWLDWMLALNTTLEWEQCLVPEMESGVLSRQRELLIVSFNSLSAVISCFCTRDTYIIAVIIISFCFAAVAIHLCPLLAFIAIPYTI